MTVFNLLAILYVLLKKLMKLIYSLLGAMLLFGSVQAQTTILAARTAFAAGTTTATVAGRVTNGSSLGPIRYIQDGTGGIGVYFTSSAPLRADSVRLGDSILVTGTIVSYNNLLEFNPLTSVTIVQRGDSTTVPAPVVFSAADAANAYAEQYEGMLVRINGNTSLTTTGGGAATTFGGNTNYLLNGVAGNIVRVATISTNIVGRPAPAAGFDMIGIMSQFNSTNPAAGYQLLPRYFNDFYQGAAPNFTVNPTISGITTSSLTISYSTDNAGDSKIYYGTSNANFIDSVVDASSSTTHTQTLNGLTAGTIYYVKVVTTNAAGSSTRTFPVVTASNSTGKMTAYFTRSVDTTFSYAGNRAKQLVNSSSDTLIAFINRAKYTLDIAIYNWNNAGLSNITAAVNAAKARGVVVRVIADGNTANLGSDALDGSIPKVLSPTGGIYTIMHNKFVVIDANSTDANDCYVWTGSTNWTSAQMTTDYNNIIIVQDQSLAKVYTLEFEEMWGSTTTVPGDVFNGTTGTARFGANKTDNTPHFLKIGGSDVQVYFSPSDGTNQKIIGYIGTANQQIQTANLVLTRTDIATALRNKVQTLPGACSGAILNDTSGASAAYNIMAQALQTRIIRNPNRGSQFHHKYLIVDHNDATSDPLVFTGSHNWSGNGDTKNDENSIVIHNQAIANQYYQEFAARMIEFSMPAPCNNIIASVSAHAIASGIKIYPNPATGFVIVEGKSLNNAAYNISDLTGKEVGCGTLGAQNEVITSGLHAGTYLLRVASNGMTYVSRIVIQ